MHPRRSSTQPWLVTAHASWLSQAWFLYNTIYMYICYITEKTTVIMGLLAIYTGILGLVVRPSMLAYIADATATHSTNWLTKLPVHSHEINTLYHSLAWVMLVTTRIPHTRLWYNLYVIVTAISNEKRLNCRQGQTELFGSHENICHPALNAI